jgi:hypothetical protein
MSSADRIELLSAQEKIRFFHLMTAGICMQARGLASDSKESADLRLEQSDAIIEMLHRLSEQSEHYYRRDDAQRPDADLFEVLQTLETMAHLHGIVSSASEYAFRKLPDAR